jgi:hypothetical protein
MKKKKENGVVCKSTILIDPTYDRVSIEANPIWGIAFILSECFNNNAPIGWSRYIWAAREVIDYTNKFKV